MTSYIKFGKGKLPSCEVAQLMVMCHKDAKRVNSPARPDTADSVIIEYGPGLTATVQASRLMTHIDQLEDRIQRDTAATFQVRYYIISELGERLNYSKLIRTFGDYARQ